MSEKASDRGLGSGARSDLWHALAPDIVLERLDASPAGLRSDVAGERHQRFGPNELPPPKRESLLLVFLRQFKSPLIYLLLAASVVSAGLGEWSDAGFIFGVLMVNAVIGTYQEWRAASSAMALMQLTRGDVVVVRDGERRQLDSAELVPGDIVDLESGVRAPADIRLLADRELQVDESLLTGESTPVVKDARRKVPPDAALGDRSTMIFAGTSISSGRATGVVARIGLATELGAIARATSGGAMPPLLIRLQHLAKQITVLMTGAIIIIGTVQLIQGVSLAEVFFVAVALAVAAIPEGLPVAITVALSIGMARMARRNVVVRSLPAVEGLGACTLIGSDKTGTLTCNELTVKRIWLPGAGEVSVGGEGYSVEGSLTRDGKPLDDNEYRGAETLARSGLLCNEAHLYFSSDGVRHVGDTVDVAFQVLAAKLGWRRDALLEAAPQLSLIPYEPRRRFGAALHQDNHGGAVIHVKGAAEIVLAMCAGASVDDAYHSIAETLAADGYRVLAVARGRFSAIPASFDETALTGLEFLGFVGLIDPVRPEVPAAIEACRQGGIDTRMITGDHPATALAIARELGLADQPEEVMTGGQLARYLSSKTADDGRSLTEAVKKAKVFARVDAVQKLQIVKILQDAGHFVAVTGDGANDAPALDAAHIGVAMGDKGTDVARGAADLIIQDDNFASIVAGIEEGRITYDNVRKVTMLLIGTGIGEIVLFILALVAGLPMPLFAVQLLWLNLATNGIQHVALAFEKGEPNILRRRPRPPEQPIFDNRMVVSTALAGSYMGFAGFAFFYWAIGAGIPEDEARTALLLLMVLFENVHIFNCRSEGRSAFRVPLRSNPWIVLAVLAALGLHAGAMLWPPAGEVLKMATIDPALLLIVFPTAFGLTVLFEGYKRLANPA